MKSATKLAFSVYALTLVLGGAGVAYAGSYNPTCDGNLAWVEFANLYRDPDFASGQLNLPEKYDKFDPSMCDKDWFIWGATSADGETAPQLWTGDLAMFCYRIQAPADSVYTGAEYDGKSVTGWKLKGWYETEDSTDLTAATKEIIIPVIATSEDGLFAVDASVQNFAQAPEKVGWRYSLEPVWEQSVAKLSLNMNCTGAGCGVNGIPGSFPVNYWLNVEGEGMYLSSDLNRIDLMTTSANPVTPLPTRTGYTFSGFNVTGEYDDSLCSPGNTLESARGCAWISSNGYVTRADLGKFYVESQGTSNPITELKAAWKPNTFTVKYDVTSGIPVAWQSKGYDMPSTDPAYESCTYDADCVVKNHIPGSDTFIFLGWKCTSSNCPASLKDKLLQTGNSIKNATAVDGDQITLTAQWKVRTYPINMYVKMGDTTPVDTVYHVYNAGFYASEEDATNATQLTNLSTAVQTPTNNNYVFRGWVFGDNANPVSEVVEADTVSLAKEYTADAFFAGKNGVFGSRAGEGWFIAGEDNQTVSAYATWARPCETNLSNVATCELVVMNDGAVWYKNACDTGYHMNGANNTPIYNENMDKQAD